MRCHTCKQECEKPQKCSKCQKTIYCSRECQAKDWKVHKRSVCPIPSDWRKVEKFQKQFSGPGYAMGGLMQMENLVWEERRRNPIPNPRKCDGCFRLFRGVPFNPHEDDFEEKEDPDCGDLKDGKRCPGCDWTACWDCVQPENQAWDPINRPSGTCRCPKSNFGESYCLMSPSYFHGDHETKHYHGDRHPEVSTSGYDEDAFEDDPRKCKTCGKIARCMKKEHLKDLAPPNPPGTRSPKGLLK